MHMYWFSDLFSYSLSEKLNIVLDSIFWFIANAVFYERFLLEATYFILKRAFHFFKNLLVSIVEPCNKRHKYNPVERFDTFN